MDLNRAVYSTAPVLEISGIQFGLPDPDEWRAIAGEQITKSTTNSKGTQQPGTVNSLTMGSLDRNVRCLHCKMAPCKCEGKYGIIELPYPVYNPHFQKEEIPEACNIGCIHCRKILLDEETIKEICQERNLKLRLKLLAQAVKKVKRCDTMAKGGSKKKKKTYLPSNTLPENPTPEQQLACEQECRLLQEEKKRDEKKERARLESIGCCGGSQVWFFHYAGEIFYKPKEDSEELNEKGEPLQVAGRKYYISPARVYELLKSISLETRNILGTNDFAKPSNMMMEVMPVPPMKDRPSNVFSVGLKRRTENPTTRRCGEIAKLSEQIRKLRCEHIHKQRKKEGVTAGTTMEDISPYAKPSTGKHKNLAPVAKQELILENGEIQFARANRSGDPDISDAEWADFAKNDIAQYESMKVLLDENQYLIGSYIREDAPIPKSSKKAKTKSTSNFAAIRRWLKGKRGLIRGSIQRRGNDFVCRAVIVPHPNIDVDQVMLPECIAKHICTDEYVTQFNIEEMKQLIRNGPKHYPGANRIRGFFSEDAVVQEEIDLEIVDRYAWADKISLEMIRRQQELGQQVIIERHVQEGDYVIFNRQPSLHKPNLLGHRVIICGGRAIGMNSAACHGYGADFDGDAVHLHIAQTIGGKTETRRLVRLELTLRTPQSGTPIVAPIQDFVLAAYCASFDDIFMSESQFRSYLAEAQYLSGDEIGISQPAMISKDPNTGTYTSWRTGKQLISELLPDHLNYSKSPQYYMFEFPQIELIHVANEQVQLDTIVNRIQKPASDKDFLVLNGEFMQGVFNKSKIGSSGDGLIHKIIHECGNQVGLRFMSDFQRVIKEWFADYGFSLGPSDYILPQEKEIVSLIDRGTQFVLECPLLNAQRMQCFEEENVLTGGPGDVEVEEEEEDLDPAMEDEEDKENENDSILAKQKKLEVVEIALYNAHQEEFTFANALTKRARQKTLTSSREEDAILIRKQEQILVRILKQFFIFVGQQGVKQLTHWNRLLQMVASGAKGNVSNIIQILIMQGQQELANGRPLENITAHHPKPEREIAASWMKFIVNNPLLTQGFIKNAFGRTGLSETDFYAHQKGSREGLVKSALGTGEWGYKQRQLVQGNTNLVVQHDLTVRDAAGNLVQIIYGLDGFDPMEACSQVSFKLITLTDSQMAQNFDARPFIDSHLWNLEQWEDSEHGSCASKQELDALLKAELDRLVMYRNLIREQCLYLNPKSLDDLTIAVPTNIRHHLQNAAERQARLSGLSTRPLTPSLLLRCVQTCMERLYSHYPGYYNRLWKFEAFLYSELCVKNVLIHYGLNFDSLEYLLWNIEQFFSAAIIDPQTAVGILASQSAGESFTQSSLDSHRTAGSQEFAEGGTVNVLKELLHLSRTPKNPSMTVYPISLESFRSMVDEETFAKLTKSDPKTFAHFISDQLVYHQLHEVMIVPAKIVHEPFTSCTTVDADKGWMEDYLELLASEEIGYIQQKRSEFSIRIVVDADKCAALHLTAQNIETSIRTQFRDLSPGTPPLPTELVLASSVFAELNAQILILRSPTFSFQPEDSTLPSISYWVFRLYFMPSHQGYTKNAFKKFAGEPLRAVEKFALDLHTQVKISGVAGIRAAIVQEEPKCVVNTTTGAIESSSEFVIFTKGTNLEEVLGKPYVDASRTVTTHIPEAFEIWGIEPAANCLYNGLKRSMVSRDTNIADCHLQQIVKTIAHRGIFVSMNSHGINHQVDVGPIQKSTFEHQVEALAEACYAGQTEMLGLGITENVMVGKEAPIGTGAQDIEIEMVEGDVEPELLDAHRAYIKRQTLPVLTELDLRILLENSGEERCSHPDPSQVQMTDEHFVREMEYLLHRNEKNLVRWTSLNCQQALIPASFNLVDDVVEEDYEEDEMLQNLADDENTVPVSLFWQQMEEKRLQHQEWIKQRVAAKKCLADHVDAVSGKLQKKEKPLGRSRIQWDLAKPCFKIQESTVFSSKEKIDWTRAKKSFKIV